jgi:hypothetical protein
MSLHKAVRLAVYLGLWLLVFVPAIVRNHRGKKVPAWWHFLIYVTGLMLSVAMVEELGH